MIHYLDEQIQVTINFNNITIDESGLYRYDLIDDVGDDPLFIGNCYIEKGASSRSIDITEVVRSLARYDANLDFQVCYIVKIYNKNQTAFDNSSATVVVPIYRYPNRKSRLETPLQETKTNWYVPSLQGYNYSNGEFKTPDLLPKVPFISTEQLDYKLLVNYGTLDAATKSGLSLYIGVDKNLNINNNSLTWTNYTLKDLFTGDKEVETIAWDWVNIDNIELAGIPLDETLSIYSTLAPLEYQWSIYRQPNYYSYSIDEGDNWSVNKIDSLPFTTTYSGKITANDYLDTYICINEPDDAPDNDYLNFYPTVNKDCRVSVTLNIEYAPNNLIALVTDSVNGVIESAAIIEADAVVGDTFKIELGKVVASGDQVDKTWTNITVGNTIEFDDTSDSTWLKIYSSDGTLIDKLTLNSTYTEDGSFKEYAFKFEESSTGKLEIYPLQQVYNIKATLRNYISESIVTSDTISIRKQNASTKSESLACAKSNATIVQGNGTIQQKSYGYYIENNDWVTGVKAFGRSAYILKPNGEVYYFTPSSTTKTIPLTQIDSIYGLYDLEKTNGSTQLFVCEIKMLEDWYYNKLYFDVATTSGSGQVILNKDVLTGTKSSIYNELPTAKIDYCPAKYYLAWRDRYGSQQIQPFEKIDTYSESFTTSETKDYRNNRRVSNVSIQPKWKLNTGWLNDNVYPYYESIFVSPYLTLYDTTEDKSYPVMVTNNDYTEKTFRNQSKQLFNLQLDVELNNTQNILY